MTALFVLQDIHTDLSETDVRACGLAQQYVVGNLDAKRGSKIAEIQR